MDENGVAEIALLNATEAGVNREGGKRTASEEVGRKRRITGRSCARARQNPEASRYARTVNACSRASLGKSKCFSLPCVAPNGLQSGQLSQYHPRESHCRESSAKIATRNPEAGRGVKGGGTRGGTGRGDSPRKARYFFRGMFGMGK